MNHTLKLMLPLVLLASPAPAQVEAAPAEEGPVTRQTAVRDTPILDFEYSWPEAISPETALVEHLNRDLASSYAEALDTARENKTLVEQNNGTFHQNSFSRIWSLEGQTERLTSLVANTDTFTGGAHPNRNSFALLWDRAGRRQVKFSDLFSSPDALATAVREEFCRSLDAERLKRREGETLDGFNECPDFSELTIAPADANGNGPFDTVRLIADPYVAGPYAEGDYEVAIPVSAELVAALKPDFRGDFEAQRRQ